MKPKTRQYEEKARKHNEEGGKQTFGIHVEIVQSRLFWETVEEGEEWGVKRGGRKKVGV